jgi:uroporphyrinogen decarboxylase
VALQGNLDPAVLFGSPLGLVRETERLLKSYGPGAGHVFNLGHGIAPSTPPEQVALLVETVHAVSRSLRAPSALPGA